MISRETPQNEINILYVGKEKIVLFHKKDVFTNERVIDK